MASISPPTGIDLSESITARIIGVDITLLVIATIAVGMRLVARFVSDAPFWWDDWFLVLSLVFAYGNGIMSIIATQNGIGRHIWAPGVNVATVTELIWIYEFFWGTVVTVTKISLVLLYYRIFPTPLFRRALYGLLFLILGWWIAIIITAGLQCRPYHYFWTQYSDPQGKGVCIDYYAFFISNGSLSVVTDFLILIYPIPMILKLQMPKAQKLTLLAIFLLAGFACIAGVMRVYFITWMYRSADLTWNQSDCFIWSCIEPCVGILCACLPTLRPLIRKLLSGRFHHGEPGYASSGTYRARNFLPLRPSGDRSCSRDDEEIILVSNVGTNFSRVH